MIKEATKFDGDKVRMDLIPPTAIIWVGWVMTKGAAKYGAMNYLISPGLPKWRYFSAALRHIYAWFMGSFWDDDTGCPHLACAAANCLMAMETAFMYGDGDSKDDYDYIRGRLPSPLPREATYVDFTESGPE